ncbi:hypothetical protein ACFYM2_18720 [Streptomyces sp. NPDC006711]|uniref:hypothetical protein n=1 Tax=Streptomyces sp. NPDC006711 TaxID=3364762 RepID=UPI00369F145D
MARTPSRTTVPADRTPQPSRHRRTPSGFAETFRPGLRRPATAGAAALVVAGVLVLTGCGGGSKGAASAKSTGVASGAASASTLSSTAPSASAAPVADAANRPKVVLPPGNVLTFDPERSGDSVKDAILTDNAEYLKAIVEAIGKQEPTSRSVAYYSVDAALIGDAQWISGFVKDDTTLTGTVRYFDRQVTVNEDGTAELTYCGDETQGFTKDRKTGKVDVTPPDKDSYISYVTGLRKSDKGVWQTTRVRSVRGDAKCQR